MDTTIRKAESTDIAAIKMLWQFYQYHQSIFDLEDVGSDGCYDIDEEYLECVVRGEEDCIIYLVLVSNQIAGFATVEPTEIVGKEIPELADIFILPKYRKQGIAKFVIQNLMPVETNQWHVAVHLNDSSALKFWNSLFAKLNVARVDNVDPPETEGYHEFVITNN
ncbi:MULTISPECIES: GNAT family N-acetyltransferase [unclassified Pseudoalteromonas]|jgi:predicted acetyltransferase|uniref:GNAT family N-acetyltransferase n=1 Tax=unclassified Pseudoalteromonas TaxID=194690 RepID=UPI0025B4F924|nr:MULTISPECIES: GNAT family N-acetyltransferase [unclassified Pseudoalteromonas]MDN3395153.1 GNAT family N-acetyltransferase [Pseudoalteromonas sp. APC 3215]MDN3400075.1 GNAT family N-acetyltransferase [Pseudoalteromonas sp. APC 3213]MDN3429342.1 GNAT family N-acetyltransferase [Pseudoalteromonas sp. APC 3907]MDN3464421.1 GNAT family N-acetyltransferase [Pseudoalteromonas sp. APC 3495]MDN3471085.1 GNAT family N-acetyltransferase [Pseudoalteromonas sp. APC 4026]